MEVENRTVLYTGVRQAELVEGRLDDRALGPHEIFARTLVTLVSNGSERGGMGGYPGGEALRDSFRPTTTGYAAVLEALSIGAEVTAVGPGELFFAETPHQAYSRLEDDTAVRLPEGIAPEQAVFCRFPAVSMSSILQSAVRPTEPVLVTGLGIVGLFCAQVLQLFGYETVAVDPSSARRETAASCGVRLLFADAGELSAWRGRVGAVMECSGMEAAAFSGLRMLRPGGELWQIGVPWYRSTEHSAHELLRELFYGFVTLHSGWEWSLPRHSTEFQPDSHQRSIEKSLEWLADGRLRTQGCYRLFAPADCGEVYRQIAEKTLPTTAAMFDWRGR